ncbi:MAG: hypothetical protein BGP12_13165 [Rhodospirillales bacterium 70-18]|mgnify:CR=1 FL=1|nr:MAG: hypothetical protein BGP12_13165 [Rhodospirillales bacterium 70-18]
MSVFPAVITDSSDVSAWLLLIDAVERLSGARSLEDVIDVVRRAARSISRADGATFVLRDNGLCHYVDEDAIGPLWKGQKFPMSACISGWAMLNRQTAVIPDIYLDPRIPHDAYRPTFVKSLVMVPVGAAAPVAAIGIYWATEHRLGEEEVARLESLARATSTAIANVALKDSLSQAAETAQAQAGEIRALLDKTVSETAHRLKVEEQLRHSQKMEAIGNLTGGLAHDFNNLLAIITGNLDMLNELPQASAEVRELTRDALDAALRGAELTRSLLAFARRQPLAPRRIGINAVITSVVRLLQRSLGEAIELELRLAPNLWPVLADPAQLESAIANLANNARDAMPKGGRIVIATCNAHLDADYASMHVDVIPGPYVAVEFSDSGTGMAPEVASRIFEPFFTTKSEGKGTGLGLAMVFGFMRQSGGHINVYSEPGRGTTFRLYLPRAVAEGEALEQSAAAVQPLRGAGEVVLVVDDNDAVRQTAVRQLRSLGYRVVEAMTAAAAMEILLNGEVALLFTDIVLRDGMGGVELARQATARWPMLRVLLTSGYSEMQLDDGAEPPPGARLLSKPYRLDDLMRAVREALDA